MSNIVATGGGNVTGGVYLTQTQANKLYTSFSYVNNQISALNTIISGITGLTDTPGNFTVHGILTVTGRTVLNYIDMTDVLTFTTTWGAINFLSNSIGGVYSGSIQGVYFRGSDGSLKFNFGAGSSAVWSVYADVGGALMTLNNTTGNFYIYGTSSLTGIVTCQSGLTVNGTSTFWQNVALRSTTQFWDNVLFATAANITLPITAGGLAVSTYGIQSAVAGGVFIESNFGNIVFKTGSNDSSYWGVLSRNGNTPSFRVYSSTAGAAKVQTFNNTLDDGSGNMNVASSLTLGTTNPTTITTNGAIVFNSSISTNGAIWQITGTNNQALFKVYNQVTAATGSKVTTYNERIVLDDGNGNMQITGTGTLSVGGTSTLTGNVTCGGTLSVTGTSTLTGNVTMSGAASVGAGLTVTGNGSVSGNWTVGATLLLPGMNNSGLIQVFRSGTTNSSFWSIQSLGGSPMFQVYNQTAANTGSKVATYNDNVIIDDGNGNMSLKGKLTFSTAFTSVSQLSSLTTSVSSSDSRTVISVYGVGSFPANSSTTFQFSNTLISAGSIVLCQIVAGPNLFISCGNPSLSSVQITVCNLTASAISSSGVKIAVVVL